MTHQIQCILTDIEGTTSSITFVHDVLFPYAYDQMEAFVQANRSTPEIVGLFEDVRAITKQPDLSIEGIIEQFKTWIKNDEKITPLKNIQGHIWAQGYANGDFQAHVYPDAIEMLKKWQPNYDLWVYSSGSVKAQALFFSHSCYGDILNLFQGLFDTTMGQKKES